MHAKRLLASRIAAWDCHCTFIAPQTILREGEATLDPINHSIVFHSGAALAPAWRRTYLAQCAQDTA